MSIIGVRMRELRGSSSQREMADAIGIKYNAWARYEAGGALPGAEIIEKICRIHACSADWLLGLKDNGGVNVKAGNGAAVAIGANARARAHTAEAKTACRNCRYKKMFDAYEAAAKKTRA